MLSFIILALLLGFKHSYDADHLIAVSNILRKTHSMRHAIFVSCSWAIGHMVTASIITVLLFFFRESLIGSSLAHFDIAVGIMIIALGMVSLYDASRSRTQHHDHSIFTHSRAESKKEYVQMLSIGVVHGLASNDELLLLFTVALSITSLSGIIGGVGAFSIGVVLGMVLFALIFSYPLIKKRSDAVYRGFALVTGTLGVLYGLSMLIGGY